MDKAPDAYRTISEVGEDLDLPQHVLRFWETRFTHIKPLKRGGGRRYYRPDDVELLKGIRHLLYKEGYTIKGVQRILKEQGPRAVMAFCSPDLPEEPAPSYFSLPQAVSPPPAYAPQPAPLAAPVFAPPPPPPRDVVALVPDLPGLVLPPLEMPQGQAEPEAPFELPHTDIAAGALADDAEPPMMVQNPEPAAVPAPAPSQVSMFRGGLQRSEPAAELPLMVPAAAPTPVSYTSSTYAQPVSAPPGHARVLLLQALEELSVVRGTLDRLLATRAA